MATMHNSSYALRSEKLKPLSSCAVQLTTACASPPLQPVVIAICGSLNPIHNAHFKLFHAAKGAVEQQGNVKVLGGFFSPVGDAYGKPGLQPAAQRVRVIADAVQDHPDLNVDTWECQQPTYTRTYYVLDQLEQHVNAFYAQSEPEAYTQLPTDHVSEGASQRKVKVVFVCGADLFSSFWKPGCWPLHLLKQLLDSFRLVVVYRDYQGEVKTAEDFERACQAAPMLTETVGGETRQLNMRQYTFTFAHFDSPDDTSSTAVREAAVALLKARADPDKSAEVAELRQKLSSMVPARAVEAIINIYGADS